MNNKISLDNFLLLMRSLDLEYTRNPSAFTSSVSGSFSYSVTHSPLRLSYVFICKPGTDLYVSFEIGPGGNKKLECPFWPWGEKSNKYKECVRLYKKMMDALNGDGVNEIERKIIDTIPAAQDVITEYGLIR